MFWLKPLPPSKAGGNSGGNSKQEAIQNWNQLNEQE
jgi:hypothetical protein